MIVNCITDIRDGANHIQGLTIGKAYQVIAMMVNLLGKDILFNIQNDFGGLSFYSHNHFEIIDSKIDLDWVIRKVTTDEYILLPDVISYKTFYEDYHDDDKNAKEIFNKRYPSIR